MATRDKKRAKAPRETHGALSLHRADDMFRFALQHARMQGCTEETLNAFSQHLQSGAREVAETAIQVEDTLAHPQHVGEDGQLRRFHRIVSNPPFGTNFRASELQYKDRFRFGLTAEGNGTADLLFVQHMLAVLQLDGVLATVVSHGVLFRRGPEQKIRQGLLESDTIEAVIGLPPNLFHGTSTSVCILVMRSPGGKPQERRGKVIFINADAEFESGRAQNRLNPAHIEKIVDTYEQFCDVPGYASVVEVDEIAKNEHLLNVRRYADNTPPPEPNDVRAHLLGGVPKAEVLDTSTLLDAHGFCVDSVFVERNSDYYDFSPQLSDRSDIRKTLLACPHMQTREQDLRSAFELWWQSVHLVLHRLPTTRSFTELRRDVLTSFSQSLTPIGLLDKYQLAGIIAEWWNLNRSQLRMIAEMGWRAALEDRVRRIQSTRNLEQWQGGSKVGARSLLIDHLLRGYLQEIVEAQENITLAEQELEELESSWEDEASEEQEGDDDGRHPSSARAEREARIKALQQIPQGTIPQQKSAQHEIDEMARGLCQHDEVRRHLKAARKHLRSLRDEGANRLEQASTRITEEDCAMLLVTSAREELANRLEQAVVSHRHQVVEKIERWWDKYRLSLNELKAQTEEADRRMQEMLRKLGYYDTSGEGNSSEKG